MSVKRKYDLRTMHSMRTYGWQTGKRRFQTLVMQIDNCHCVFRLMYTVLISFDLSLSLSFSHGNSGVSCIIFFPCVFPSESFFSICMNPNLCVSGVFGLFSFTLSYYNVISLVFSQKFKILCQVSLRFSLSC